jgi:hypothetical protein
MRGGNEGWKLGRKTGGVEMRRKTGVEMREEEVKREEEMV